MAREFVERMAYEAIGDAMHHRISAPDGSIVKSHVQHRRRTCSSEKTDDLACCHGNNNVVEQPHDGDVMSQVRCKISDNFQHYSNLFQGLALPVLFRHQRRGSEREGENEDTTLTSFEFVESIELQDMEAFMFESEREIGRGHNFVPVQLKVS